MEKEKRLRYCCVHTAPAMAALELVGDDPDAHTTRLGFAGELWLTDNEGSEEPHCYAVTVDECNGGAAYGVYVSVMHKIKDSEAAITAVVVAFCGGAGKTGTFPWQDIDPALAKARELDAALRGATLHVDKWREIMNSSDGVEVGTFLVNTPENQELTRTLRGHSQLNFH